MLTDLKLKNIKFTENHTPKLYPDIDGLYLRVSKTKKRWYLRFMFEGTLLQFYGKEYPDHSLKDARTWAGQTRDAATRAQVVNNSQFTFRHFLAAYRKQQVDNKRAASTLKKLDMRTNKYLDPYLDKDIREFTPATILDILRPIGDAGTLEAQTQVREILDGVFLHAFVGGVCVANPVYQIHKLLPKAKVKNRAAVVNVYDFGRLIKAIRGPSEATPQLIAASRLLPLLFVRSDNLRFARWSEFDLQNRMWHIPAERTKTGQPLDVPLCRQAMDILLPLYKAKECDEFVFGRRHVDPENKKVVSKTFSEVLLREYLLRLGYYGAHMTKDVPSDAKFHSPHGYRASFRTICDEILRWRVDILEHQLGHLVRDTNGVAYNRTSHLDERIRMMQLWADFLDVLATCNTEKIDEMVKELRAAI